MRGDSYRSNEPVPCPPHLSVLLKSLGKFDGKPNTEAQQQVAIEVWNDIANLGPLVVPPKPHFENPSVLTRWQNGGQIPDSLVESFATWLEATRRRTNAITENERRLRNTTWAQMQLRDVGDYFEQFAAFHRDMWSIRDVCSDIAEREQQVQAVARNGQRRDVRHG